MSSFTRKTAGSNAAEQATHTTASITPSASTVTFIHFTTLRGGAAAADTPTVSGAGLTWAKVRGALVEDGLVLFTYVGTGSGSAGALTITHAGGDSLGSSWIVDECSGCDTTNPVVQSVAGTGTSTALLATLAAFSSTSNATYGVGDATTDPITAAGSGFTSLGVNTGVFDNSMITEWKATNDTTVDATAGGSTPWAMIAMEIAEASGSSVTKTPTTGNLSLGGLVATHNAFNHVRIRDVLINESGQPIVSASNITLKVWYSGYIAGPADFSRNGYTTDADGTASWSITRGSLVSGQTILYVAQDSLSFSNYTMARMVPNYEA